MRSKLALMSTRPSSSVPRPRGSSAQKEKPSQLKKPAFSIDPRRRVGDSRHDEACHASAWASTNAISRFADEENPHRLPIEPASGFLHVGHAQVPCPTPCEERTEPEEADWHPTDAHWNREVIDVSSSATEDTPFYGRSR